MPTLKQGGHFFHFQSTSAVPADGDIYQPFVITINKIVPTALDNAHFSFKLPISFTGIALISSTDIDA